jgi:hypothetical protein
VKTPYEGEQITGTGNASPKKRGAAGEHQTAAGERPAGGANDETNESAKPNANNQGAPAPDVHETAQPAPAERAPVPSVGGAGGAEPPKP